MALATCAAVWKPAACKVAMDASAASSLPSRRAASKATWVTRQQGRGHPLIDVCRRGFQVDRRRQVSGSGPVQKRRCGVARQLGVDGGGSGLTVHIQLQSRADWLAMPANPVVRLVVMLLVLAAMSPSAAAKLEVKA